MNKQSDLSEIFRKNVREKRKQLGLSMKAFAQKHKITYDTVTNTESRLGNVKLSTVEKFAEMLGVKPYELLKD